MRILLAAAIDNLLFGLSGEMPDSLADRLAAILVAAAQVFTADVGGDSVPWDVMYQATRIWACRLASR